MNLQSQPVIVKRDTSSWKMKTWLSFGLSSLMAGLGVAYLPGQAVDRVFMFMGYTFCVAMIFVLSKFVRDRAAKKDDTPMFSFVAWGGMLCALALTGWGLWRMELSQAYQGYLVVCWFYLVSATFTLAKMLRDEHEANQIEGVRHHEVNVD